MENNIKKNDTPIRMRNYGRILQDMITQACAETDVTKRQQMTVYIAQCMRQKNAAWNKEQESGVERLQNDIRLLSHGVLDCDFPEFESLLKMLALKPMAIPDIQSNSSKHKKK